jgi:transposase-like protein
MNYISYEQQSKLIIETLNPIYKTNESVRHHTLVYKVFQLEYNDSGRF